MAVRLNELFFQPLGELRYVATAKRVRVSLGGQPVADSQRAVLVWEPKRVVPSYAVPAADISADLRPAADTQAAEPAEQVLSPGGAPVLTPDHSFAIHTTAGRPMDVVVADQSRDGAAFSIADPDLAEYVVLDFDAFEWREEDDPIISHPRDPFHRVDVRHSSRTVRIERDGTLLAESSRPTLVFETNLPVRYYLPPEDVRTDVLSASGTNTSCAYKGRASYFSLDVGSGPEDVAWYYPHPLPDAAELAGLVAFFDEHVDVVVDGVRRERPTTPWSKRAKPSSS